MFPSRWIDPGNLEEIQSGVPCSLTGSPDERSNFEALLKNNKVEDNNMLVIVKIILSGLLIRQSYTWFGNNLTFLSKE